MGQSFRVVHYLNQFFAGIGGEEQAGVGPEVRPGAVGPGRRLAQLLAPEGEIVAAALCGDNYFADQPDVATAALVDMIRPLRPDVVLLGPAFNSGRHGVACGQLGTALARELGIPCVSGMHAENPGVELGRAEVVIALTGADARDMSPALERMAALTLAAVRGALPGPAAGGYFARGLRLNVRVGRPAAERALDLLLCKLRGEPFQSELTAPAAERVAPAPPVRSLASATVAFVTDGGLVVRGNPERLAPALAERYTVVDVAGQQRLDPAAQEVTHRGYDTALVNEDPNRLVPLDAARELECEGRVGRLSPRVYTTAGCSAPVANARHIGQEIAAQLQADGVEAVILTST
jgi:glycine reductase